MNESVEKLFKKYDVNYRQESLDIGEPEWWSSNAAVWFHISAKDGKAYLSVTIPKSQINKREISIDSRDYVLDDDEFDAALKLLELYLSNIKQFYLCKFVDKFLFVKRVYSIPLLQHDSRYFEIQNGKIEDLEHLTPYAVKEGSSITRIV